MFKIIFTLVLIAVAFIHPMISLGLFILLVLVVWAMQAKGTATINSTAVGTFEKAGKGYGFLVNTAEKAWLDLSIIDAENATHREELQMEVGEKAIPAFKAAVSEMGAVYAPTLAEKKAKLAAAKAKLAESKARREVREAARAAASKA